MNGFIGKRIATMWCAALLICCPFGAAETQTSFGKRFIVFVFCQPKAAIGIAQDDNVQLATSEATKNCLLDGGNMNCCTPFLTISNSRCGAVAWDPNNGNGFAKGFGPDVNDARALAVRNCATKGLQCSQFRAQCH